jgi:signal transduction histidine kinase
VMRLATDLGNTPQPGTVASAIAAEAHDPSLEFLYWLPHRGWYVDAAGQPREAPEEVAGRSLLRVTLAGRLIGLAVHDPGAVDSADLDRLMGPAARLALENERLHAELLVKVDEVRASRARIVATGDAARARAERDLHDGAQQAILAAIYELRAAAGEAEAAGNGEALSGLRTGIDQAGVLLAELREIAHGIYPAVLADRGLGAALRTLADTATIPVAIGDLPDQRLPDAAERTGYAVVAGAVEAAAAIDAEELSVLGRREDDRLMLEIRGLGTVEVPEILDRVSAADGDWSREGEMLRVWIPCA